MRPCAAWPLARDGAVVRRSVPYVPRGGPGRMMLAAASLRQAGRVAICRQASCLPLVVRRRRCLRCHHFRQSDERGRRQDRRWRSTPAIWPAGASPGQPFIHRTLWRSTTYVNIRAPRGGKKAMLAEPSHCKGEDDF